MRQHAIRTEGHHKLGTASMHVLGEKQTIQQEENKGHLDHTNKDGNWVLVVMPTYKRCKQPKIFSPTERPYVITKVYQNKNIRIISGNYEETINIQCQGQFNKQN